MKQRYINREAKLIRENMLKLFRKFVHEYCLKDNSPADQYDYSLIENLNAEWKYFINKYNNKRFKSWNYNELMIHLQRFKILIASYILKHYYGLKVNYEILQNHFNADVNEICINYIKTI